MGFGFNLAFVLLVLPLSCILLMAWPLTGKKIFGKMLALMWTGIILIVIISAMIQWLTEKKELSKSDYYGEYIIDRDFYKGKQADWQYNTFRFQITKQDSIFFYVTEGKSILQTYRGVITTNSIYKSQRLSLNMQQPTHHIVTSNPTTFRRRRSFYLVFHSPKFNNVFFKKGEWTPVSSKTN